MTRAEQRALEAYPIKMTPLVYQDLIDQFGGKTEIDVNTYPRCLFQEGYEQAAKNLLPKIARLAEAILFEWDNKVELAKEMAEFAHERLEELR